MSKLSTWASFKWYVYGRALMNWRHRRMRKQAAELIDAVHQFQRRFQERWPLVVLSYEMRDKVVDYLVAKRQVLESGILDDGRHCLRVAGVFYLPQRFAKDWVIIPEDKWNKSGVSTTAS